MAKQETLQAEKREVKGTTASKRLRRSGTVPAVVYGSADAQANIQLNAKAFSDLAKAQSSQNFLVNLQIEGSGNQGQLAIVQDIQKDALTGNLIHVDFRAVSESDTVHATVPIVLSGEPVGVKAGGLLEQLIHEIEITCRPSALPEGIFNDVTELGVGDTLKVADLNLPEGVAVKLGGDVLVAVLAQTRASISAGAANQQR